MAKKPNTARKPKTKLRFKELLGKLSITKLADEMNVTYTQLYPYKKVGANPTLLALEQLAAGLSAMRGEPVSVTDLIDETSDANHKPKRRKNTSRQL